MSVETFYNGVCDQYIELEELIKEIKKDPPQVMGCKCGHSWQVVARKAYNFKNYDVHCPKCGKKVFRRKAPVILNHKDGLK